MTERTIFESQYGKLVEITNEFTNYLIVWNEKTFKDEVHTSYISALQEWAWRNNFIHKMEA